MTTWRLLKRDDEDSKFWQEIGTHESDTDFYIGYEAYKSIGEYHGAGEYLLLSDDRNKTLKIGERSEFFEIVEEEPEELEPVSLKAAPSAADVMAREG